MIIHTILYVADQQKSTEFYSKVLDLKPTLNVPGMTEFHLTEGHVLGLMPEAGIKKLLGETLPDPAKGNGIPRVELYIRVENPECYFARSKELGAKELSPILARDWGGRAGYVIDSDGHVIAFAT
jgi:catechol 2,3-dioxygenase-like lactoylglutathione lyase family enzyme